MEEYYNELSHSPEQIMIGLRVKDTLRSILTMLKVDAPEKM